MAVYRRPFTEPGESRRPTLTWPRQIPIEGEPADVVEIVRAYGEWLKTSQVPKLFINADPGAILRGGPREFCRTLAESDRSDREGHPLHPGRFAGRDRCGARGVDPRFKVEGSWTKAFHRRGRRGHRGLRR